ncbi:MAG: hypothetical protein IPK07_31145 [Deltaproteobacteria bacterium]|nr:hypothetical protein [Deltaproteobacteria bacterium]
MPSSHPACASTSPASARGDAPSAPDRADVAQPLFEAEPQDVGDSERHQQHLDQQEHAVHRHVHVHVVDDRRRDEGPWRNVERCGRHGKRRAETADGTRDAVERARARRQGEAHLVREATGVEE